MKYIYDANLFVCPFCHDSWYVEEDNEYRVCCHCGTGTRYYKSKINAEIAWNKIIIKKFNIKDV